MRLADILGLVLALLGLLSLFQLKARGQKQALTSDRRDSTGSKQQFDELMQEAANDEARRARLWEEAASSPRAARRLQRDIQNELRAIDEIRRYMAKETPDDREGIQDIDMRRKEIELELQRVAALIDTLRG